MNNSQEHDGSREVDRRNFLKAVGVGVSLSAIDLLSEDEAQIGDITYNPDEEVPYVAGWKNHFDGDEFLEKEPVYGTMSIEQWDRIHATRDAIETIGAYIQESDLNDDEFLILQTTDESSDVGRQIETVHLGDNKPQEELEESLEDLVPSSLEGHKAIEDDEVPIPISTSEIELGSEACVKDNTCYGVSNNEFPIYDDVPGGAPVKPYSKNVANVAGPFSTPSDGAGWATAYHVVNDGDPIGNNVFLAQNNCEDYPGEKIGDVADGHLEKRSVQEVNEKIEIDVAYIENTVSDKDPHEWIASKDYQDNEDIPLTTVIADTELEMVEGDTGWNLYVQGHKSCREGPSHVDTVIHDLNGEVIGGLMDDHYTDDGDSGGPVFHKRDGEAYICGVHKGYVEHNGNTKSHFVTAQTTETYLGGNWMVQ